MKLGFGGFWYDRETMIPSVEKLRPITTPHERAEAEGFVGDALLAGDDAGIASGSSVRPTHIARDDRGTIALVKATVEGPDGTSAEQVFSAP